MNNEMQDLKFTTAGDFMKMFIVRKKMEKLLLLLVGKKMLSVWQLQLKLIKKIILYKNQQIVLNSVKSIDHIIRRDLNDRRRSKSSCSKRSRKNFRTVYDVDQKSYIVVNYLFTRSSCRL